MKPSLLAVVIVAACTPSPDDVVVSLSPEVISSLDGTVAVHAEVFAQRQPSRSQKVSVSIDYTDRNGMAHAIAPVEGTTDARGAFDTTLTGLIWDGSGTITVTEGKLTGLATFSVLDRTPPKVTIAPPTNNSVHVNMDATIQVHVSDEIGISQVTFEATGLPAGGGGGGGGGFRQRSTVVASGTTDAMVAFDLPVPDFATLGSTITMYALAADLSGNEAAATPVMVMVVP